MKKKWALFVGVFAILSAGYWAVSGWLSQPRDTLQWAQQVTAEQIARVELVVSPADPEKCYRELAPEEYETVALLLQQSMGSYVPEPEPLAGGGVTLYLTMTDGSTHQVSNNGNVYLVIDGESFDAPYDRLLLWQEMGFDWGDSPAPEGIDW